MSDFKRNLVESADSAARVGVLIVAVTMFAAMWESDSPPTNSNDSWLAQRTASEKTVAQSHPAATERQAEPNTLHSVSHRNLLHGVSMQAVDAPQHPMPAGIVVGSYRVVDSLGQVQTLLVTSEMVSGTGSQDPQDQYILEDGDRTIYFIRIRAGNDIAAALTGSLRQ